MAKTYHIFISHSWAYIVVPFVKTLFHEFIVNINGCCDRVDYAL